MCEKKMGCRVLYGNFTQEKKSKYRIKAHFLRCFSLVICLLLYIVLHTSSHTHQFFFSCFIFCCCWPSSSTFIIFFFPLCAPLYLYITPMVRTPEEAISKQNFIFWAKYERNKSKTKEMSRMKNIHSPHHTQMYTCVCLYMYLYVNTVNARFSLGMCTRFEDHKHLLFSNYMIWAERRDAVWCRHLYTNVFWVGDLVMRAPGKR